MPRGELKSEPIHETIVKLNARIESRFPGSGLGEVGQTLLNLAAVNDEVIAKARRPIWWLRVLIACGVLALLVTATWAAFQMIRIATGESPSIPDLLQGVDAAVNEIILLGLALVFMTSMETRFKRRQSLSILHRLRGLAHVVDMHQLTKDPEFSLRPDNSASETEKPPLDRFQLERYLDYCSEMLALTSKLAALHLTATQDPVVLSVINEIEALVTGLTRKIWQKIIILQ
ncbi:MAG: hypothetical protein KDA27_22600 [Candidatus Eisenbacteria bacterium]|uniref:Uncharacterized protein n=1 Tax=Eiseniibacteriota bacterium TaxID=2212470 RepID=A0A956NGN5_UNCEI|nr:hypothetical protein [Candidatus Eisenbacteria bacterium]MCB9464715.1 hypothetical protein [Candidatus Eisenbacteria bacterium]